MLLLGSSIGVGAAFPLARASLREPPAPVIPADVKQRTLVERSLALLQSGKPEQALPLLVEADTIGLKSEVVQNNLCVAFNMLHRYEDAIQACTIALVLKPDFNLAQNNLLPEQSPCQRATASERGDSTLDQLALRSG